VEADTPQRASASTARSTTDRATSFDDKRQRTTTKDDDDVGRWFYKTPDARRRRFLSIPHISSITGGVPATTLSGGVPRVNRHSLSP
jgi:hypothetical protein